MYRLIVKVTTIPSKREEMIEILKDSAGSKNRFTHRLPVESK
jgi:hypothetical protein